MLDNGDVCALEIQRECLQALTSEKYFIICGIDFAQQNLGRASIIVHTMHRKQVGGIYFRNYLRL